MILAHILGLCVTCAIIVVIIAIRAPSGREIPGVGFVLDDPDQTPWGDVITPPHITELLFPVRQGGPCSRGGESHVRTAPAGFVGEIESVKLRHGGGDRL